MALFRNQTHRDIWVEHNCRACWRYGDCPILERAVTRDRKPVEWKRNTRKNVLMQDAFKCDAFSRTVPPRPVVNVDVPMFDVEPVTGEEPDHA